jgi:hypothetical protein
VQADPLDEDRTRVHQGMSMSAQAQMIGAAFWRIRQRRRHELFVGHLNLSH